MKIEELFKKAEKFFNLKKSVREKKDNKKEKLEKRFKKKISILNKKIKSKEYKKEKKVLIEQLHVLEEFAQKLKGK